MNQLRLMKVVLGPRVTEKSTRLAEAHRQFVFRVVKDASKPEIKKAVELMFNVQVECVQICNVRGKSKAVRGIPGRRPGWKKAYVRLKPGFDIELISAQ
ncbi:MAG: 50S ribosomal protein L23 [Gammaproteobacteria bacterium]|nr:50S ribosomal protein L23 [Gammaproteobacteria bacterium]MCI0590929.1 50S ribosomal protein L23 [Gammaproteobacteria bacterium]